MRTALGSAGSIENVRVIEANAAAHYFASFRNVELRVSRARPRTNPRTVASLRFASVGIDRCTSRGDLAA